MFATLALSQFTSVSRDEGGFHFWGDVVGKIACNDDVIAECSYSLVYTKIHSSMLEDWCCVVIRTID